jgi:hypothetical protein
VVDGEEPIKYGLNESWNTIFNLMYLKKFNRFLVTKTNFDYCEKQGVAARG